MDDPEHGGLPAEFWSKHPVREALATCDMPTLMAAVQGARGWSQTELASRLGYSQSWVSRVIRRRQQLTVEQVRHMAERLQVPRGLLRLGGDGPTTRREFTKLLAATGLGLSTPRVAEAEDTPAAALRAITTAQRRLDATSPARDLARGAIAHLDLARRKLSQSRGATAAELAGVVSEAAGFAAWLHADMLDLGSARRFYRAAINAAVRTENGLLAGYMTGSLAAFEIDRYDPDLGLRLVAEAGEELGPRAHPAALAWLRCIEALGHAVRRDNGETSRALRSAESAVDAGEHQGAPPWPWVFPFDHAKLAGYRALAAVRLGQPRQAARAFADALPAVRPAPKQHAVLMLEVATMHSQSGDHNEAFGLASDALTVGVAYRSERVIQHARRFRRTYEESPPELVRDFDEQLRASVP
jgi:transcriptional regulator with XRE-family HTH domain